MRYEENVKKYNVGVIGTGSMGRNHLRVVHSTTGFTLVSAADTNQDNLNAACDDYPVTKYHDYQDMVDGVDAVMVSVPTEHHYEICKFFLENNKHVLVEKPITINPEQAEELIALADENHCVLAVGHLERCNPAVQYIKDLVNRPLFIETQRLGPFSPRSLDVDVVMDLMIHDLDIILQWDKSEVIQINASGIPLISNKTDIATVRLEFESGLVANVTASRVSQKKTRKLRIFQKNRYFSLDYKKKRVKMFALENGKILEDVPEIADVEPLSNLWNNFYKTLETGQNFNVTGRDGCNALKLAVKISKAIEKRKIEF